MIKFLQHVRGGTSSPGTVSVATVVIDDAWQSPKTSKADISALDATKPCASSLQNTLLRRPRALRVPSAPVCARARRGPC